MTLERQANGQADSQVHTHMTGKQTDGQADSQMLIHITGHTDRWMNKLIVKCTYL